eukprot:1669279-Amphidinium_carterae.2
MRSKRWRHCLVCSLEVKSDLAWKWNAILYNPREMPPFRSCRLTLEEVPGKTSERYGKCPLCKQTIDARMAYAAQAYFDLLQGHESFSLLPLPPSRVMST